MQIAFRCPQCHYYVSKITRILHRVVVEEQLSHLHPDVYGSNPTFTDKSVYNKTNVKVSPATYAEYKCGNCKYLIDASSIWELLEWLISKDMLAFATTSEMTSYFSDWRPNLIKQNLLSQEYIDHLYPNGEPKR